MGSDRCCTCAHTDTQARAHTHMHSTPRGAGAAGAELPATVTMEVMPSLQLCFGKRTKNLAGRREFEEFRHFQSRSGFLFPGWMTAALRGQTALGVWGVSGGQLRGPGGKGRGWSVPLPPPCSQGPARLRKVRGHTEGHLDVAPETRAWHPQPGAKEQDPH